MATYSYSTITDAQAAGFTAADTLLLDTAPANQTTVLFVPGVSGAADQIILGAGTRSVTFNAAVGQATRTFPDGATLYIGTAGNDGPITTGSANDGLYGGQGDDTLNGGSGGDQLQGNQGRDSLSGGAGDDIIYGGQDNDQIDTGSGGTFIAGNNFAQGNKGDDTINGSATDHDILLGGQGNDLIGAAASGPGGFFHVYLSPVRSSFGGGDVVDGNLGDDIIFGGGGDTLLGEDGNDALSASIAFGRGSSIDGGAGADTLVAQNGEATLVGGAGDDLVTFQNGFFVISLGDGNDTCGSIMEISTDRLTVDGGAGDDLLDGSDGSDSLAGGEGRDVIDGYSGADTVSGGAGADEFQFFRPEAGTALATLDRILDWEPIDHFYFCRDETEQPVGAGTATNYAESTAPDYASALAYANGRVTLGIDYIAVQVGGDVFVFVDTGMDNGVADSAVRLVRRSLLDIGFENFAGVSSAG